MENNITAQHTELNTSQQFAAPVRFGAHLLSYVFHPLFISTYVTAFLLFIHPYAFAGMGEKQKVFTLVSVFFSTGFLPAFAVLLMRALGFVQSFQLRTQKERIIPYVAAITFYFWIWYVYHNLQDIPVYYVKFLLGSFLAVCAAWMFNIRYKISMHATGVGGLVMFFYLLTTGMREGTALYFAVALIIAGLVCTARFIVSDHTQRDIYSGFLVGMLCQLVATWL
ncbi:hypothetical protein HHL16_03390 [Pseudoflavitalea sp. G-6-1-2]|uniref:hypothetical protein n=1 Tax=Pseudoflavitalea sp. G-6-1-2 TaxID=2728841 RepID=UPI00146E361C|nr:hypothetical protein [Pseudoflavitalea sp. G-6-1-2]NML19899.1 hypothetical protein [Pseudoflavitalea sp. G-6-1-2]